MLHSGARWRDCPADYGPYTTIYGDTTALFRYQYLRTNDPVERYKKAVEIGLFSASRRFRRRDDGTVRARFRLLPRS